MLIDEPKTLEGLQEQEQELAKALKTQESKVTKIKLDRLQKQQEEQEEIDALLLNNSTLKQQIRHINLQLRALDGPSAEQANENLLTSQPDTKDELVDQAAELTSVIKQFQTKLDKLQQDKDDQQQQLIDNAQKEQDRLQAEQNRLQQEQEARDKAKQEHDQLLANVDKATAALQAAQLQKQQLQQEALQAEQNAADLKTIQDRLKLEQLQAEQAIQDAQNLKDNLLAQQQNYTQNYTPPTVTATQNLVPPATQQPIPSVTSVPTSPTNGTPVTSGTGAPSFPSSTAPLSGAFVSYHKAPPSSDQNKPDQSAKTRRQNVDDMANSLIPAKFAGMVNERADLWIADLEAWMTFKGVDEKNKVDSVPLLLKGTARIWFDAIAKKDKDSFQKFKDLFIERFKRDETTRWKDVSDIWNTTQRPDQPVEEFITEMEQKGLMAKAPPQDLKYAIMNGLKPYIRQALLAAKSTNSLEEIRQFAIAVEAAEGTEPPNNLAALTRALESLERKFDSLHVNELQAATATATTQPTNNQQQTQSYNQPYNQQPRQNNNNRQQQGRYNNQNGNQQNRQQNSNGYQQNNRGQYNNGQRQQQRQNGQQRQQREWTNSNGQQQQQQNTQQQNPNTQSWGPSNQRPPRQNQGPTPELCTFCSRPWHQRRADCPAFNETCYRCQRRGHFSNSCRAVQPAPNSA